MSRVLFAGGGTGGHLYPALALADALKAERPDVQPYFVGALRGVESRVLPQRDVPHTLLPIEPIYRDRIWRNARQISAVTRTLFGLHRVFRRERPALVVGTGGYASGPACAFALTRGVPVALQEQNSYPGATTKMLSRWARQVHLGFAEAEKHLKIGERTRVYALGNPIKPPLEIDRGEARRNFGLEEEGTVLLVVGGSQGARAVNHALLGALDAVARGDFQRPAGLQILWATGPTHIETVSTHLAQYEDMRWGHAFGYIENMPYALASADVAISRAGAMGTAELLAWGIPAVLVPLPTSAANHQVYNAEALAAAGAAVSLLEQDATPELLWSTLRAIVEDHALRAQMAERARERARPDAAREIARELLTLVDAS